MVCCVTCWCWQVKIDLHTCNCSLHALKNTLSHPPLSFQVVALASILPKCGVNPTTAHEEPVDVNLTLTNQGDVTPAIQDRVSEIDPLTSSTMMNSSS